jgi:threonine synthase
MVEAEMAYPDLFCSNCGEPYPKTLAPYRCSICGGLFDFRESLTFDPLQINRSQPGIWRYRHTFGLSPDLVPVSLGEGGTPLLWVEAMDRRIAFKCDYLNPTGSFKDRGSAVITTWLNSRGITEIVEDSSGNAGASLAAYAARAGIRTRIFIPESAAGPKRRQIEAYGAELVPITGSRSDVTQAVRKVADSGAIYASHAYSPHNLHGYASAAYEIFEQIGKMPGTVIVPAGQGGFLLGLARGFEALRKVYRKNTLPMMIGVQTRACAPLWALCEDKGEELEPAITGDTLAEGVLVANPVRGDAVRAAIIKSRGFMCVVDEEEIMPARDALARLGFYVEPTSAIAWAALIRIADKLPDPIVVVLTGSGLKYG